MIDSIEILENIYHRKVELLLFGLKISDKFYNSVQKFNIEFNKGRKGGAGPAGGRYFIFNNDSVVNVPLWGSESEKSYLVLEEISHEDEKREGYFYCIIKNEKTGEFYKNIRLIPLPIKYNNQENLNDTINKQIALVHGTSCLASTIVQRCVYWKEGKQCNFCGIELSLKDKATIGKKTGEQLVSAIKSAKEENFCEHMTLTSGTLNTPDKGAKYYIKVVKEIKKNFPNLPIHIQIEPFEPIELLKELKISGVDTIGIHFEIINDKLRSIHCPGKFKISKSTFEKFWQKSVEIFGEGQVSTFILVGFEEKIQEVTKYIEKIISLGVIPFIVPVRSIPGTKLIKKPIIKEEIIKIYDSVSNILLKYGLNPLVNKAGCVKCGGCSALFDAYNFNYLKTRSN